MKTWTEQEILDLLGKANNEVLAKMLVQAADVNAFTRHNFLKSVARGAKKFGRVTDNQAPYVRKGLREFVGVLTGIANCNEQAKATGAKLPDPFAEKREREMNMKPWGGIFEREPSECKVCKKWVPRGVNYCSSKCANDDLVQKEIDDAKHNQVATRPGQESLSQQQAERDSRDSRQSQSDDHGAVQADSNGSHGQVAVQQGNEKVGSRATQSPVNLKPEALRGDLYSKSWDEVFNSQKESK